jgi:Lar family restriction alleviation protein
MFTPQKSCPFCGSRETTIETLGTSARPFYAVECEDCEATGPLAISYEGAVEKWNARPKPDGDGQ